MWNGVVCDWGCVCVWGWVCVCVCDRGPGSLCPPACETECVSPCVSDRIYMTEFVCDFGRVCVWVPLSLNVSMVEYVLLNVSSWSVEFPWGSVCMAVCICVRVCVWLGLFVSDCKRLIVSVCALCLAECVWLSLFVNESVFVWLCLYVTEVCVLWLSMCMHFGA